MPLGAIGRKLSSAKTTDKIKEQEDTVSFKYQYLDVCMVTLQAVYTKNKWATLYITAKIEFFIQRSLLCELHICTPVYSSL